MANRFKLRLGQGPQLPPPPADNAPFKEQFHRLFGPGRGTERVHVVRAPGRVNLIGEHTDYNDGFVLPMAIEPEVRVVCRARNDCIVRLSSTAFPNQRVEFSVQRKIQRSHTSAWDKYSLVVTAEMIPAGIPLVGLDSL